MREFCVQRDSVAGLVVQLDECLADTKLFRCPIIVKVEASTMLVLVAAQRLEY